MGPTWMPGRVTLFGKDERESRLEGRKGHVSRWTERAGRGRASGDGRHVSGGKGLTDSKGEGWMGRRWGLDEQRLSRCRRRECSEKRKLCGKNGKGGKGKCKEVRKSVVGSAFGGLSASESALRVRYRAVVARVSTAHARHQGQGPKSHTVTPPPVPAPAASASAHRLQRAGHRGARRAHRTGGGGPRTGCIYTPVRSRG